MLCFLFHGWQLSLSLLPSSPFLSSSSSLSPAARSALLLLLFLFFSLFLSASLEFSGSFLCWFCYYFFVFSGVDLVGVSGSSTNIKLYIYILHTFPPTYKI
ncbi:hypothetical protein ACOSQ3_021455 [Xanthoceras sorbifolium]